MWEQCSTKEAQPVYISIEVERQAIFEAETLRDHFTNILFLILAGKLCIATRSDVDSIIRGDKAQDTSAQSALQFPHLGPNESGA